MPSGLWHPDHPDAYYDDDPSYYDNLEALRSRDDAEPPEPEDDDE
jgi:hypothetical protein